MNHEEYPVFDCRRKAAVFANQNNLIVEETEDAHWTVAEPPASEPVDLSAFHSACKTFRAVCKDIGELIGVDDFKGGFDEFVAFKSSKAFNTLEGLHLAMEWSAVNELCKFEGAKVGFGQPEWWKYCWEGAEK